MQSVRVFSMPTDLRAVNETSSIVQFDIESGPKRSPSKRIFVLAIVGFCLVASCSFAFFSSRDKAAKHHRMEDGGNSVDESSLDAGDSCPIKDFDYLLLAVRWAPSACLTSSCVPVYPQQWLIHGLWPNFWDGTWPEFCCKSDPFDEGKVKGIENDLLTKWSNLLKGKTAESLWAHEWDKHGTCSAESRGLVGEMAYFGSTLKLYDSLPIDSWLAAAGITPNDEAKLTEEQVLNAIAKNLPNTVEIHCEKGYLDTISFCYDKTSLTPIDCPTPKHTCKQGLIYPTAKSST